MERHSLFQAAARLIAAALVSASSFSAAAETGQDKIDAYVRASLLNNVVKIDSVKDGLTVTGMGFIIGRFGESIWVTTAAHVVFPGFIEARAAHRSVSDLKPATGIVIHRKDDPTDYALDAQPEIAIGGDMAFLSVRMPRAQVADAWRERVIVRNPDPDDPVWIAGTTSEIIYGTAGAKIGTPTPASPLNIDGLVGGEGQSGAPVATALGFVGMYVSSDGERVIPIARIERAALDARRPWQLSDAPLKALPVRICFNVSGEIAGQMSVDGPRGRHGLDASRCAATESGDNQLIMPPGEICDPTIFTLSRDPNQMRNLTCSVDPAGLWMTDDNIYMKVTADGVNGWLVDGLDRSPFGWARGKLTGVLPDLFLAGEAQNNNQISGNLQFSPSKALANFTVGTTNYRLEFHR
ncbi:hypothetical protein VPG91_22630 [Nitrospirillum amazonense]|uniref:hypothetical protein n=1 Tax=Nitrospirillum amazonense TaxID=28077 RepID=UPI002DD41CC5|nr:hypothetical protein [Nitrospirillum amazonense]MEC4593814.1 hypothetical protein [Nitrospirillum amazonense]